MQKTKKRYRVNQLDRVGLWLITVIFACTVALGILVADARRDILNRLDEIEAMIVTMQTEAPAQVSLSSDESLVTLVAEAEVEVKTEEPSYLRDDILLSHEHQTLLYNACQEFDIPFELGLAVCWRETCYRNVCANDQYFGYMQLAKKWVWPEMEELGVTDLMDPEGNFRIGCYILRQHIDSQGGVEKALCRYSNDWSGRYTSEVLAYMNTLMEKEGV